MIDSAAPFPPPDRRPVPSLRSTARPPRCLPVEDSRFDRSPVRYLARRGGVEIDSIDAGLWPRRAPDWRRRISS